MAADLEFDAIESDDPAATSSWHEWFKETPRGKMSFESIAGLLAAIFLGIIGVIAAPAFCVGFLVAAGIGGVGWFALAVFIHSVRLAYIVIKLAGQSLEGDDTHSFRIGSKLTTARLLSDKIAPLAIAMASRIPKYHIVFRLIMAFWWLAHFVAGAAIGHLMARGAIDRMNAAALMMFPLSFLISFAFLFAGNLYLVLSIAVMFRSKRACLALWRARYLLDATIAGLFLFWR